ncbi:hypothetical protein MRS44_004594 [Fusarium solani]|uniref:uncharacterized protein n=1 Tax=Fusarium solani TaxID=169388 RepID=UPI0032C44321|nr:hypothetical protein MRS44_004594 [Fusarium solani]
MRILQLAWLLAGFLAFLGQVRAQDFTVGGWTFDGSCRAHQDYVTASFEDTLKMVTKAQSDLNLVLPRFEKKSNPRQTAQYRIARAMGRCFGFMPDAKNDNAKTDQWWSRLSRRSDSTQRVKLKEDFKMKNRHPEKFAQGYSGGWYYRQRMDWRKKVAQNPPGQPCMDGATGTTLFELDVIHICSVNFQSKPINAGSPLMLTGFLARKDIDQQSLNKDGKWVYNDKDGQGVYRTRKHSEKTRKKNELIEDVTYGYIDVSNLAKTHNNGNGEPEYATETAEAYAFFAMMSIMDGADWVKDGIARKVFYKKAPSMPVKLRV